MTLMNQEVVGENVEGDAREVELKETRGLVPSVADESFVAPVVRPPKSPSVRNRIKSKRSKKRAGRTKVFLLDGKRRRARKNGGRLKFDRLGQVPLGSSVGNSCCCGPEPSFCETFQ